MGTVPPFFWGTVELLPIINSFIFYITGSTYLTCVIETYICIEIEFSVGGSGYTLSTVA